MDSKQENNTNDRQMKKQSKQQPVIDLDTFEDVSLYQMNPSGKSMGLSLLKTLVDSVLNGNAKLSSLLIAGSAGLQTHAPAFIRALGIDNYNQIDGSLLQSPNGLHMFFCPDSNEAFIISNADKIPTIVQLHITNILTKQQFSLYNYLKEGADVFEVSGLVVMTSKSSKKVPAPILDGIQHIVEIEGYTTEQLELVILQRCKYASVEIEDQYILSDIVQYGEEDLEKSIRFLRTCITVMQAEGRQRLIPEDVIRAGRLNRLPDIDIGDDIPF